MIYTNQDAADLCAGFIEGGVCVDHPLVLPRLNEAQRRLLKTDDMNFTLDQVRIFTRNNNIALPREYTAARLVTIDSAPVGISSQAYEYIASGPGKCIWDQLPKLIDEGVGHCTFFPVPTDTTDWYLIALGTDVGKSISWRGRADDGTEILTAGSAVNSLEISKLTDGTSIDTSALHQSAVPVRKVTGIALPDGRLDYVSLYAYDPTTHQMYFLSKYSPSEKTPGYRKYRLPRWDSTNGVYVELLCKKQAIPATSLNEVLLVQDLDAIKEMVMSIEQANKGDVNGAVAHAQLAQQQIQLTQSNENKGIRFNMVVMGDNVYSSNLQ